MALHARRFFFVGNLDEVESSWCAEWVEHRIRHCQISCRISWGIMGALLCDLMIVLCVRGHSTPPSRSARRSGSASDAHKQTPLTLQGWISKLSVRFASMTHKLANTHVWHDEWSCTLPFTQARHTPRTLPGSNAQGRRCAIAGQKSGGTVGKNK